jgi:multiple sugar transport system substrate-binding protein
MATMKDVAREAGVSVATVSNYINNTKNVSSKLCEKIADAIERLHFVPNQAAKTLKSNFNNNIGVILPNIQDNYYTSIFQGIERFFYEKGYCVNIGITNDLEEIEQRYIIDFLQRKVSGLIIVTSQPDNKDFFINNITSKKIPLIHIDRRIDIPNAGFLTFNNKKTLFKMADYFLKSGKRNITIITGHENYSCENEAVKGYIKAFEQNNIPVSRQNIVHTSLNKEAAFRSCVLHLKHQRPEVIITTSKPVTLGVLESLAIAGFNVPENVIVATLGEDNWSTFNDFQNIVSSSREAISMGNEAAKQLYAQITEDAEHLSPKTIVFEDKYQTCNCLIKSTESRYNESTELRIKMLDTLQVNLFEGLLPWFKNNYHINTKMEKVPHNKLLDSIYNDDGSTDVFMYDMPWLYSMANDNVLADISDYIKNAGINKSIYLKDCMDIYGKYQNKNYGLPFMYAPQILFYRKDLFQSRALRNEFARHHKISLRPPRSWKDFNSIAHFFTNALNPMSPTKYGTAVAAAYKECLIPEIYMRMRAYASQIYNKDLNVTFKSDQTIKAYTNFTELIRNASPDCTLQNDMSVVDEFLNGNIAMLVTYPSFISNINDLQRSCQIGQVGFAHIPGKCPILGGWGLGVSEKSKNKELAFRFIHWACGESMSNYSTIMAGQSAIAKVFDNNELISLYPWLPLYKSAYDIAQPITPPFISNNKFIPQNKIDAIISKWLYKLIADEISIDDTVSNTHTELNQLFHGYKQL